MYACICLHNLQLYVHAEYYCFYSSSKRVVPLRLLHAIASSGVFSTFHRSPCPLAQLMLVYVVPISAIGTPPTTQAARSRLRSLSELLSFFYLHSSPVNTNAGPRDRSRQLPCESI